MRIFLIIHHEIMGPPDHCRDDEVLFYTASSLKKAIKLIQKVHVDKRSWWEIQMQTVDDCEWPEHVGYYGLRDGKLAKAPFEKCVETYRQARGESMTKTVTLQISGQIACPATLTAADLAALPLAHQVPDVTAIVPNRPGTAIRLAGLLELVQPAADVKWLTLHASADDFHASIPLEQVREKGLLIYALNGEPLSPAKGGPFRFFIPDYLACHSAEIDECANVKFVDYIELTATRGHDNRPHDDAAHAALHEKP